MSRTPTCYLSPKAEGRYISAKGGRAVFAVESFVKDEMIVIWGGEVISGEQVANLPQRKRRLILQVEDNHYLLTSREGPADWINHSCDPNAGLFGHIVLVAMRNISEGEEICFDYAMSDSGAYDEFDCHCGAANCRGRFSTNDWKMPELWKKYEGYFSPYLQKHIDEIKLNNKRTKSRTG